MIYYYLLFLIWIARYYCRHSITSAPMNQILFDGDVRTCFGCGDYVIAETDENLGSIWRDK